MKRILLTIALGGVIIFFNSMVSLGQTRDKTDRKGITAIKFLDYKTYPHSIDEKTFWENSEYEFAKMNLNFENGGNALLEEVKSLKKIEMGLSENFDYAFLLKGNQKTDTLYASLHNNLWTIKENGQFVYYEDTEGRLKNFLQSYSSFFSECW